MIKISAIIITFNEEEHIERCLLSLQGIADEIVVVDSFSTDNTEGVASRYDVRFIKNKFEGHIQQKNFALEQTLFPYVLSLDADEELSEELKAEILKIKGNWKYDAYYFNRNTRFYGKWLRFGDWYPDRKLRLWKKEMGSWGGINPHDKVIMNAGAKVFVVKKNILHYYYNDCSDHLKQLDYFSTVAAREYFLMRRKSNTFIIMLHSGWRFFRAYILMGGFLDGNVGYIVAVHYSYYTFLKYTKLRQLWSENSK
jgi:glycosyltransferase involved in cell wall biosynthesis